MRASTNNHITEIIDPSRLCAQTDLLLANGDEHVRKHLPTGTVEVGEFRLPKFKLDFSTSMNDVLQDLGIKAFQEGKADFYDMVAEDGPGRMLTLQEVVHMAVIEVNEEGTEAAAVTACRMLKTACRGYQPPKLCDGGGVWCNLVRRARP